MSDGYVFENVIPEEAPVHAKMDKRIKWLLIALAIILAGELIWVLGVTPCMPLSVIEIAGIPELDRGAVLNRAGIGIHSSYMTVDARGAELALGSLYQVESARVVKQFPDTVRITLEPRRAVAMALAPVGGRIEPVFFDRYGVVYKIGQDAGINMGTLPIISGLFVEEVSLGMRFPALYQRFFSGLESINSSAPELMGTISEIRVSRKPYEGFELALYPVHYPAKIRVGNELTADTIRYMLLLIDVFIKQGVVVDEIDFRTGTASYKKEATRG
jgi:cell division protein FtsQ